MGTLYLVGTPIGNLEDVTLRALRILGEVDVIYCEDTRVTKRLLDKYKIDTPLRRLDANVEKVKAKEVIERLMLGEQVAYVSDAGTPGVSDPGARLIAWVRQALGDAFPIRAIPGPSALTAAISIAGIDLTEFVFLGFPPHKKGRRMLMQEIAAMSRPCVLYESTHRILKLLRELAEAVPDRRILVIREITKMFEEVQEGTPSDLLSYFTEYPEHTKGEFVVVIGKN
jgi:16S rRNA (cytidine1402-2'-O)-methyltransferase